MGFVSFHEVGLFFVSSEVFWFSQIRISKSVPVEIMILKMSLIICTPWEGNQKSQKLRKCWVYWTELHFLLS